MTRIDVNKQSLKRLGDFDRLISFFTFIHDSLNIFQYTKRSSNSASSTTRTSQPYLILTMYKREV